MKVRKAIIPAAGLGTRFLPATKAQPKEMLPIVDKPTIQYIIEEAVASGIEDILIITGRNKRAIEDHFDKSFELESILKEKNQQSLLEMVEGISNLADIYYIRQGEAKGLGHAIYCARKFIGDEPFAVLLGDDIVDSEKPCLGQLMAIYDEVGTSVLGTQHVAADQVNKYGIVDYLQERERLYRVRDLVEKPAVADAPSTLAILGRYIITPEIFTILSETKPGSGQEIQLTDALQVLSKQQEMFAYQFEGIRYDVGDRMGYLKATVDFALKRDDISGEFSQYLREISAKICG